MSASLLALASLVVGCTAPTTYPPLANIMECVYSGFCHTEAKGFMTRSVVRVPDVEVPHARAKQDFVIPDKCGGLGRELAGMVVHACDGDVTPALALTDSGVGLARLRRHGDLVTPANVYIKQFCI